MNPEKSLNKGLKKRAKRFAFDQIITVTKNHDLCSILNAAVPGKHYDAPSYNEVKVSFLVTQFWCTREISHIFHPIGNFQTLERI